MACSGVGIDDFICDECKEIYSSMYEHFDPDTIAESDQKWREFIATICKDCRDTLIFEMLA